MRSGSRWWYALTLVLVGCTSAAAPTSTTSTTLPPATTTSTVESRCPDVFCVVFRVDPNARWSDGTPVTGADFEHTLALAQADDDPAYTLVTGLESSAEGEITLSFSRATGGFSRLFQPVLPAHDPAATSGGFDFDGDRLESPGTSVEFVPVDGVRGSVTALQRGEVDMVWLKDPPAWAVDDLAGVEGATVAVGPGPDWEMVTFNQADPLLAEEWVRRAIAMSLDREAMADATVRTVHLGADVLDSTLAGIETEPYPIAHNPTGARSLLEANGCVPGPDGIMGCGGLRMSFDWVTTTGDPWRLTMANMAAESLAEIGVEVSVSTRLAADLFSADHLFGEEWDMVAFAWEAQTDPVSAVELYRCRGDGPHGFGVLNIGRHCGDDALLAAAEASFDPDERADLMRIVDRDFVAAAALVPLFSRPIVAAWGDALEGVEPGPFSGPLDRVREWSGTTRIAVTEPSDSVRSVILRGAFRARPGGEYLPDLVIDFETIGG